MIVGFTGCGTDGKYSWSNLEKYQHANVNKNYKFHISYSVDSIKKHGNIMHTDFSMSYYFSGW